MRPRSLLIILLMLVTAPFGAWQAERQIPALDHEAHHVTSGIGALPVELPHEQIRTVPIGWAPGIARLPVFQWKAPNSEPSDVTAWPFATNATVLRHQEDLLAYQWHRRAAHGAVPPYDATAPPLQG